MHFSGRSSFGARSRSLMRIAALLVAAATLSACDEGKIFSFERKAANKDAGAALAPSRSAETVEQDVEAPDVFQATEAGLWDGRPSLGGVWVAHPDVTEPERVVIRNTTNDKSVNGALFRRERDNPGPRFQISSDAAEALDILAGQPTEISVTALRRQEVKVEPEPTALVAPGKISEEPLDPVEVAATAIASAEAPTAEVPTATAEPLPSGEPAQTVETGPTVKPKARAAQGDLSQPFVQVGLFSSRKNARNAAAKLKSAGILPVVKRQRVKGKTYWRVMVGPVNSPEELDAILKDVRSKGFTDAYPVAG